MKKTVVICDHCGQDVSARWRVGLVPAGCSGVKGHTHDFCSWRCLATWAINAKFEKGERKE